jgi:hypothetical protein
VLWIAGAVVVTIGDESSRDTPLRQERYARCMASASTLDFCNDEYAIGERMSGQRARQAAAINALAPVLLGWIGVYVALWLFRWVRKGFASTGPAS